MTTLPDDDIIIARTRCWIEKAVVGFNLCPFARKPFEGGQVRYVVSHATDPETLLHHLHSEFELLRQSDPAEIETTVLIHPEVLQAFPDYNDFLDLVDAFLEQFGYDGEFQVASLHPDYQFAGTAPEDAQNYTNRSPYPVLHLLREALLAKALSHTARPDEIPQRNIALMEKMGAEKMRALLDECMAIGSGEG